MAEYLHTKIVCTLGPATSSLEGIRGLIAAGMNVARLNFSHGTYSDHSQTVRNLKQAALEQKKRVAILQDLSGPKIRLGRFVDNTIRLDAGANFTLTAEPIIGDYKIVSVNTPELLFSLKEGDRILLGDGIVELRVLSKGANSAYCQVVTGGLVGSNQGVTAPGVSI
jgi:pyruvate kinase